MKDKIVAITNETAGPGEDLRANRRLSNSFSSRRLSYSLVILKSTTKVFWLQFSCSSFFRSLFLSFFLLTLSTVLTSLPPTSTGNGSRVRSQWKYQVTVIVRVNIWDKTKIKVRAGVGIGFWTHSLQHDHQSLGLGLGLGIENFGTRVRVLFMCLKP